MRARQRPCAAASERQVKLFVADTSLSAERVPEALFRAILLGCSWGGAAIAIALGFEIWRNPAVVLEPFLPTYLSYALLVSLNGAGRMPFRLRSVVLVLSLFATSWTSMLVIGHDTGPVLICFLAILTCALLLPVGLSALALLASAGVVWAAIDVVPPFALLGAVSAIGFVGSTIGGLGLVLYLVRVLEGQLEEHAQDLATLKRATQDREAAEQQLQATRDSLEEAYRFEAIGRVAGGAAHEFNNLLQVISCQVETLELGEEQSAEEVLGFIKAATMEAGDITSDLLTIARRGAHDRTAVDVAELLPPLVRSWRKLLPSGTELTLSIDAVGCCLVNSALLQQCILNLIRNAADPDVGSTEIQLSLVSVGAEKLLIEVADNGCGMDAERQRRAFEPFFTTKDGRGTGLGLSIVRGTIEQYDGSVALHSRPGGGTTVSIMLPFTDVQPEASVATELRALDAETRVLLVEDEALLLRALSRMLQRKEIAHTSCANGDEALQALGEGTFDVLCIDAHMPGAAPVDVIRRFRECNPQGRILVCSGNVRSEALLEYINSNALPVLTKPFGTEDFYQALSNLNVPV